MCLICNIRYAFIIYFISSVALNCPVKRYVITNFPLDFSVPTLETNKMEYFAELQLSIK